MVKGGGGSLGRVDKEWWASAQEPERADWGKKDLDSHTKRGWTNETGEERKGGGTDEDTELCLPHLSVSSYACLLRLLNVFFVVISADIITLLRSIRSTSSWVRVGEGELLKFIYIPRESRSPKGIPTAPTGPAFHFFAGCHTP